ncbi:VOC family protein [Cellulomonas endophytica]|uniref:VOC family protein n=1 Tax=Cellulomonas endophytica TaxID=2494735 RepID=UPI0010112C9B|nr:VOC family protein [Cellulomonas endophytica]
MAISLNPYLGFRGDARAALEHYATVFGGELTLSTFAEGGMPHEPAEADKIMHGQLDVDGRPVLMASDAPDSMPLDAGSSISLSLSGGPDDAEKLKAWWEGLVDGGTVDEPLTEAPWGDTFGMCTDRFGHHWMVNIGGAPQG